MRIGRVVEDRLRCLTKSREAVIDYLARSPHADVLTQTSVREHRDAGHPGAVTPRSRS